MSDALNGVWVIPETASLTDELLGAATTLADALNLPVASIHVGDAEATEEMVFEYGADAVLIVEGEHISEGVPQTQAQAVAQAATTYEPHAILTSATPKGSELAGVLAQHLETGCVNEVVAFDPTEGQLDRVIFGGKAISQVSVDDTPWVLTIEKGVFAPPERAQPDGETVTLDVDVSPPQKSVVEFEPFEGEVDLSRADVIVSVGRGLEEQDDLSLIQELVDALQQSHPDLTVELGCSRPICDDLDWVPEERQVGLSGTIVAPQLYIAIGISGAIQHVTGIRDAEVVVAINTDQSAPIFKSADYGIVGDLYEVVPQLTKHVQR